jgi:hypothetical protein
MIQGQNVLQLLLLVSLPIVYADDSEKGILGIPLKMNPEAQRILMSWVRGAGSRGNS